MLQFLNSTFKDTVQIGREDVSFAGCVFAAKGSGIKDQKTPGLQLSNPANAEIKNCEFKSTGYSAISLQTSGDVVVDKCVFDCSGNYNPVEGTVSSGSAVGNVTISNNVFNGICGNNYVNFYKMTDGAVVNIEGNTFTGPKSDSEILRLSNPANVSATFNVKDNGYNFSDANVTDYTAFLMCQDYTAKSGTPQDFSKYTVNIENLECNTKKVGAEGPVQGSLFFVYEDGKGIIEGNDPVINLK